MKHYYTIMWQQSFCVLRTHWKIFFYKKYNKLCFISPSILKANKAEWQQDNKHHQHDVSLSAEQALVKVFSCELLCSVVQEWMCAANVRKQIEWLTREGLLMRVGLSVWVSVWVRTKQPNPHLIFYVWMLLFYFSFVVFKNILVTLYASMQAWLLVPTYRLNPGMHQLLSVLASQLAQA